MLLAFYDLVRAQSDAVPGLQKTWRIGGNLPCRELPSPPMRLHIELRLFADMEAHGKLFFCVYHGPQRMHCSEQFEFHIPAAETLKEIPYTCDLEPFVFPLGGYYTIEAYSDSRWLCSFPLQVRQSPPPPPQLL